MSKKADALRSQILALVEDYYQEAFESREFTPSESPVPVSGRVFDAVELQFLAEAGLDFWLTTGRFAAQFEREFAMFMGKRHAILVNSGSSANLLAVSSLTSPAMGDGALKPGDEAITTAAGFPTTVSPLVQNGLVPVFLDVKIPGYNVDTSQLAEALSPKTRLIILAHTLGNPFDLDVVTAFAREHHLWLVEDCCDALGSHYKGRMVGMDGDLATTSFYPAHHITMGEGGCVLTDRPQLKTLVESFRDWGRDCWCEPGKDNTCGKRFDWQLGELPYGYDHKYTYSHLGYNLKATDMQAAVGVAQLQKLPDFIRVRRENFQILWEGLRHLDEFFLLPEPTPGSEPSWFGFPLAVRPEAPFTRDQLIRHLDARRIGTRLLFGGNLTRQPALKMVQYRQIGDLHNSDFVMQNVFWIGVYPGLTPVMLAYVIEIMESFCRQH